MHVHLLQANACCIFTSLRCVVRGFPRLHYVSFSCVDKMVGLHGILLGGKASPYRFTTGFLLHRSPSGMSISIQNTGLLPPG